MTSWKSVVDDDGTTNELRFESKRECEAYGSDLWLRWLGCPKRPVPTLSEDPPNYRWDPKSGLHKLGSEAFKR